jgi:hypothetical protein
VSTVRGEILLKVSKQWFLALLLSLSAVANAVPLWAQSEPDTIILDDNRGGTDSSSPAASSQEPEPERVPKESTSAGTGTVLQGGVTYTVPRGTPIKLKLASVPTYAMKMMERDLDGNLLPARLGQEITARVSEDLFVDNSKVIPEGTIFHGRVSKILPPRRVGRPGSLELSFDQIITPDGRKFAFKAEADNFKPSTMKTKAKGFGIIAAHAAGGAIVGALVAYQIFGWQETVAMHGYNIAGGAAAGALMATGYAIMRHGPRATLEPGDDLNMQIDRDLLMPVAVEARAKKSPYLISGIDVKIEKSKLVRDGLGGHQFTIDALINNESDHNLSSIDLFIEDTNGNRAPIFSDDDNEDDSGMLFTIKPHTRQHVHMSFQVPYPKLKRQLVWLRHEDHTVCYREPLR